MKQRILQSADYDPTHFLEANAAAERQKDLELLNYSEPQVSSRCHLILSWTS